MNSRSINKKAFESLILGGAFDKFTEGKRSLFFDFNENKQQTFLEILIRFSTLYRQSQNTPVLFSGQDTIQNPIIPTVEAWQELEKLRNEKQVLGMYVSGHPLNKYSEKIKHRCNCEIVKLNDLRNLKNKKIVLGGMLTFFDERETKNGNKYGVLTIEDFSSSKEFRIFKNYESFNKSYFKIGSIIEVEATVEKNYYNDDLSININKIDDLDREWNFISVNINYTHINQDIIHKIIETVKNNKGKTKLGLNLYCSEKNLFLPLKSNTFFVKYSKKFKKELNKLGIVEYFLN